MRCTLQRFHDDHTVDGTVEVNLGKRVMLSYLR